MVPIIVLKVCEATSEEFDMDIGGVNRIKPVSVPTSADLRKNTTNANERDADGRSGYQKNGPTITHLTPEQEEEALKALNALPAFTRSGLTATLVKEAGKAPHIVVTDSAGQVVRHLPYSEVIHLYVHRKEGGDKGTLLKRSA